MHFTRGNLTVSENYDKTPEIKIHLRIWTICFLTFVGSHWFINAITFRKYIVAWSWQLILNHSTRNIELYTMSLNSKKTIKIHIFRIKMWIKQSSNKHKKIIKSLPKIILLGAHTSNVSFLYPFTTQWYWNSSTSEQSCCIAILLQFFLRAAAAHSVSNVGQNSTICTLLTASWQYLPLHSFILINKIN